jgi:hypothetical protein
MRTFIFGAAAAALIACGGRTDSKYGLEGPTTSGEETVDYPKGEYGYDVGSVVPNATFLGYEHMDPSTLVDPNVDVGRVRFSDFYDPDGARGLSFLVVVVQVVWCGPSNQQDDFTNGGNWTGTNGTAIDFATQYEHDGVRFMTLLQQGPTFGVDATMNDLQLWITHHKARTSQALVTGAEMMLDVVGAAWPYNMIVDLQTMRVVGTWLGFDYDNKTLNDLIRTRRMRH